MSILRNLALAVGTWGMGVACGGVDVPHVKPPSIGEISESQLHAPTCSPAFDPLRPFVAEWPGTSLSDLDVTSKGGVVVVSYDPCTAKMKVLSQCKAGGSYAYVDAVAHPDSFTMRTANDVEASLPFGAVAVRATLATGRKLEFRYTSVGQRLTEQAPALLAGECSGATHYVRSLTLGSYQLLSSADALVAGGVDVMGHGAKAQRTEAVDMEKSGGDGCEKAAEVERPRTCAVLQLGLAALGVDPSGKVASAGFGQELGALTALPRVSTLSDKPLAIGGALRDPQYISLLEKLQAAKRSERDPSKKAADRAGAWDELVRQEGKNPLKEQAAARRDEWQRVADAEAKRAAQVVIVCGEHAKDGANLKRLLALDDDVVPKSQKAAYQREFSEAYVAWAADIRNCEAEEEQRARLKADTVRLSVVGTTWMTLRLPGEVTWQHFFRFAPGGVLLGGDYVRDPVGTWQQEGNKVSWTVTKAVSSLGVVTRHESRGSVIRTGVLETYGGENAEVMRGSVQNDDGTMLKLTLHRR